MQRPHTHTAVALFAGVFFVTMTVTALGTGDLVVRTFACLCALAAMLAAEATWHARSNAAKSVAVWSITAVVFGVSIIFYSRAYPLDASILNVANGSLAAAVVLAVIAWNLRRPRPSAHRQRANAAH
jgi:hypothetical protein